MGSRGRCCHSFIFLAQLLAQGSVFRLQFPNALLFPVVAAGLTQLHPCAFQPIAQGINANAKVPGYFLGLPSLLRYHPYRTGFERLIVPRWRPPFFLRFFFHGFAPFLSILRLTFLSVNSGMGAQFPGTGRENLSPRC